MILKKIQDVLRLSLKQIRQYRLRNLLMIVSITIGITLSLVITTLGMEIITGIDEKMKNDSSLKKISIINENGFSEEKVKEIFHLQGIENYRMEYSANAIISSINNKKNLSIFCNVAFLHRTSDKKYFMKQLFKGRIPEKENEVIVTNELLHSLSLSDNDVLNKKIFFNEGEHQREYIVTGICNTIDHRNNRPQIYRLDMSSSIKEKYNYIEIIAENMEAVENISKEVMILGGKQENKLKELKINQFILNMAFQICIAIGSLVLVVCVWVLKVSLSLSINDKIKFLGLLKVLGYSRRRINGIIVCEAFLILFISFILGSLFTIVTINFINYYVNWEQIFCIAEMSVSMRLDVFLLEGLMLVLLGIIFSLKPVRIVSSMNIMETMNGEI